jgi:ketosteroid isomerase-like protein
MREALLVLILMLPQGQTAKPDVVAELKQIEQTLASSWKDGKCDAWAALVADDWSVIHIDGSVVRKAAALTTCRAPEAKIEAFTIDELAVRPFGDAAVVTGRTVVSVGGPHPQTVRLRFTDVFVRRAGRWQVVASHATGILP